MSSSPEDIFTEGLMEKAAAPLPLPDISAPVAASPKSLTSRSVFSHPDAHPLALDLVLLKNFELEWLTWLPDTLFSEIEKTFSTSIAEVNKLKILAAQTLHVIDVAWDQWEIFEKTVWALNGMIPRVEVIQPPDLPMLMAGVAMIDHIRKETYGEEVARYCAAVFLHENVFYAPEPLSFCQPYVTQPMYRCKDCGQEGSALRPFDGTCWSCGGHFNTEHPFSLEPDPEAVRRGAGKNIELFDTFEKEPTQKRFEELDKLNADQLKTAIKETSEDIQAAKLITAVDFMKHRDQQLNEQLTSLRSWLETA